MRGDDEPQSRRSQFVGSSLRSYLNLIPSKQNRGYPKMQIFLPLAFFLISKRLRRNSPIRAPRVTSNPSSPAPMLAASQQISERQFTNSDFPSGCESACSTYDASFEVRPALGANSAGNSLMSHAHAQACSQSAVDLSSYTSCICEPTPKASISACLGCAGNSTDSRKDQFAQDLVRELGRQIWRDSEDRCHELVTKTTSRRA